jgi:plastocyanin
VGNNFFNPSSVSITAGEGVVWTWSAGAAQHNVTFDDGPASETQSSGTFSRTFASAGTFPYHCTIHGTAMSGTVTVAAQGGSAGGGGEGGGGGGGGGGGYGGYE